jgi:hypothetical protein
MQCPQEAPDHVPPQLGVVRVQPLVGHGLPDDGLSRHWLSTCEPDCLAAPLADFAVGEITRSALDGRFGADRGWSYLRVEHQKGGVNMRQISARLADKLFQLSDTARYLAALRYQTMMTGD